MRRNVGFSAISTSLLIGVLFMSGLQAQVGYYFGQNKVKYKTFDWAVFRSEHFAVHYYPELKTAAHDAARMAERGYAYISEVLGHKIEKPVPLILYASLNDFAQTNVVSGLLDQGTRGVTEGLKNRVILPITGSYREFNHVLVHELVHAFQFDMMLGGKIPNNRFNPPLWFVEGMAEYLSAGMDNTTRMWVRDGLLNDKLLTVDQLNSTFDIRVYRLGQSLWHYIGENFGKSTVGHIFKTALRTGSVEMAFKKHLGMTSKEVTEAWHAYARRLAVPAEDRLKMPGEVARKITRQESYFHRMNLAPAVSPDGKHIVYVTNKNLNEEIYMLSRRADGRYKTEHIISGGTSRQFETLRFFDTSIGWSRDGKKIAFISKTGKDDVIYVVDPFSKKVLNQYQFPQLNGLLSPTFSPEGNRLAFVGMVGGISNLYVLDLHSGEWHQLTNDKYATLHPQWAPESDRIAFITDRTPSGTPETLLFSDYDVAIYDMSDHTVRLVTDLPGAVTSPQWSPDGNALAFVSDHQGIPNIYLLDLSGGGLTRLTSLKTGVSGITETTPAFSWSADGRTMVFSVFSNTSWQLYQMEIDPAASPATLPLAQADHPASRALIFLPGGPGNAAEPAAADSTADDLTTQWLPEIPDINSLYVNYALAPVDSVSPRPYKSRFKLDGISVGGGYSSFFGVQGGAALLFSDMLGNQNLFVSTELQFSDPRYADAAVTYFNQTRRLQWGLQAFQDSYRYLNFGTFTTLGFLRNTFRGFNGLVAYPFSKFSRIELTAGLTWVDQDQVVEQLTRRGIERESFDLGNFSYGQFGAALVFDNTTYGFLGPSAGSRSRFSIETTTNDIQFTTAFMDYRRYFRTSARTVLAWRLLGAASLGRDQRIFDVGGPYTYRGADFNELFGSKFFVSNLEYRFPLLFFLPANYDFLSGATYFDAAGAWGIHLPGFSREKFQPFTSEGGFRLKDLNAALGIAARVNIGFFLLQYDIAWPTDLQNFGKPVNKFSIGTFF